MLVVLVVLVVLAMLVGFVVLIVLAMLVGFVVHNFMLVAFAERLFGRNRNESCG
jgi:hypothetical protein